MLSFAVLAVGTAWTQTVDSTYRFRTIRTGHFAIHYHANETGLANSLAAIAESTWQDFASRPGFVPPSLTHVILVDQSDTANGFATPLPRNTIVIYSVAPSGAGLLNARDWLRTVFVHEFTHIVHLDASRGWSRVARRVFGRAPWAFPNLTLPIWQIEGLATWEESQTEGLGRDHAGDFRAIVEEASRAGRFEPIDRVGGGLTDWPDGHGLYAYGLGFHRYLAERYGSDSLLRLSAETAGSLPWLGTRAFGRVYGKNVSTLWREYRDSVARDTAGFGDIDAAMAERLTHHAYVVAGPRFLPRDCETCPDELAYSVRTPHERPAIYRVSLDTRETRAMTTRIQGTTLGIGSDLIYFDQHERRRLVGVYSDLYALAPSTGRVTRLTRDARLADPDVSPDGQFIVAVQNRTPGQRDLVLIETTALWSQGISTPVDPAIREIAAGGDVHFNTPRWSPDGRSVVVERQRGGRPSELIVIDMTGEQIPRVIAAGTAMRWTTPTWHPDGHTVIAAGAREDGPFNLYAISIESRHIRQLTSVTGGATWPDVAAGGTSIVFVGYTADGFDLYRMPYTAGDAKADLQPAGSERPDVVQPESPSLLSSPYRPWTSLAPTSWTPLVEVSQHQIRIGAALFSRDVLGYHAYSASATWPAVTRAGAAPDGSTDWNLAYAYQRWQPRLWVANTRRTSFFAGDAGSDGLSVPSTMIEHTTEAGVLVPLVRMRFTHTLQASLVHATDLRRWKDTDRSRNRHAARFQWRFSSAQRPGYAISPERGTTAAIGVEAVRRALGASADATTLVADARAYVPGFAAHHVWAIRGAAAASRGHLDVSRVFLLGGGTSNLSAGGLGSDSVSLLRGFGASTFAGTRAAVVNVDYRWPITRPQRGMGAWPLFVHTVHAAVIGDVGHAWTHRFNSRTIKTSVGAELSTDVVLGYSLPLTATLGAAYGHDRSGAIDSGIRAYGRVGYAF